MLSFLTVMLNLNEITSTLSTVTPQGSQASLKVLRTVAAISSLQDKKNLQ
jgi:hypothetical protein